MAGPSPNPIMSTGRIRAMASSAVQTVGMALLSHRAAPLTTAIGPALLGRSAGIRYFRLYPRPSPGCRMSRTPPLPRQRCLENGGHPPRSPFSNSGVPCRRRAPRAGHSSASAGTRYCRPGRVPSAGRQSQPRGCDHEQPFLRRPRRHARRHAPAAPDRGLGDGHPGVGGVRHGARRCLLRHPGGAAAACRHRVRPRPRPGAGAGPRGPGRGRSPRRTRAGHPPRPASPRRPR